MTEIYLIRHTQAEGNIYRMMQGHWDGNITPLGEKQIDLLAERFRDIHIDAVYSSDLYRTRRTAGAILKYHDIPLITDEALREINLGRWEARFFGDLIHEEPEAIKTFLTDCDNWNMEGAETYGQVKARSYEAIRRIAEENDGKTVAITSHGVTIRTFMSMISGIGLDNIKELPIFGNTAVNRLLYENGSFTVDYMNDTSHLDVLVQKTWAGTPNIWAESFDPRTDRDYFTSCYADTWKCAHGSLKYYTDEPYYTDAINNYLDSENNIITLHSENKTLGILEMDSRRGADEGYLWIVMLHIDADKRGIGCGTQAIGRARARCRELGRSYIRLSVSEKNKAARAFYSARGFIKIGEKPGADGKLLIMEQNIGERKDV